MATTKRATKTTTKTAPKKGQGRARVRRQRRFFERESTPAERLGYSAAEYLSYMVSAGVDVSNPTRLAASACNLAEEFDRMIQKRGWAPKERK